MGPWRTCSCPQWDEGRLINAAAPVRRARPPLRRMPLPPLLWPRMQRYRDADEEDGGLEVGEELVEIVQPPPVPPRLHARGRREDARARDEAGEHEREHGGHENREGEIIALMAENREPLLGIPAPVRRPRPRRVAPPPVENTNSWMIVGTVEGPSHTSIIVTRAESFIDEYAMAATNTEAGPVSSSRAAENLQLRREFVQEWVAHRHATY